MAETLLLMQSSAHRLWDALSNRSPWLQGALAAVVLALILALGPKGVSPFIYFQF